MQLIGISVTGLEPEFQPVVSHLLPQIISNKQDANDMHLQVGHDIHAIYTFSFIPCFLYFHVLLSLMPFSL